MIPNEDSLFGRGIGFPPQLGPEGRVAWSSGAENVRQSIRLILLTESNERLMLPEFGGGLKRFLFQPNTAATHRLIEESVNQSLGRWEPRVDVRSVMVRPEDQDPKAALVTIRYKLVALQTSDEVRLRLVFSNPDES